MSDNLTVLEQDLAHPTVQKKIKSVLHDSLNIEKFCRSVMVAAANPDSAISTCERNTLINELIKCAQDGLIPDGKEAAIVPYWNSKAGSWSARYTPMVDGVIKKFLEDSNVKRLVAETVYEHDFFEYEVGSERFEHKPNWFGDRGAMVGVYALAEKRDGTKIFASLNMKQIHQIRACAPKNPVWDKWPEQMAKKSAIHKLNKMFLADTKILEHDKDMYDFEIETPAKNEPKIDINKELGLLEE